MTVLKAAAVLILATTVSSEALAQSGEQPKSPTTASPNQDGDGNVLDPTIVVTAQKREQSLQEVPSSVSAVSGDTLANIGAKTFSDYARLVPGLVFQDAQKASAGRGSAVVIRGVATSLLSSLTGSTVATLYDETPLPYFLGSSPVDLARVEVLRGPQGTLYGAQSLGGAIKFVPNKPNLAEFEGVVEGGLSSTRFSGDVGYTGSAVVNIPIVNDKLALRLVAYNQLLPGYVDNDRFDPLNLFDVKPPRKDDVNYQKSLHLRGMLLFQPNDDLAITLTGLYEYNKTGGATQYDPARPGLNQTGHFAEEPGTRKTFLGSAKIEYDMGWSSLTSISSIYRDDNQFVFDLTRSFRPFFGDAAASAVAGRPIRFRVPFVSYESSSFRQFTQEVRLTSPNRGMFRWLVGGFYNRTRTIGDSPAILPGFGQFNTANPGSDVVFNFAGRGAVTQLAGFGELSIVAFDDRLTLTAGGRVFRNKVRDINNNLEVVQSGHITKFNLSYEPVKNILLYAQASQGFRVGGNNIQIPLPPPTFQTAYGSDKLWNYEAGIKTSWFNNRLTANLGVWHVDWSNIQSQVTSPSGFNYIANLGEAYTEGLEFEAIARPVPSLTLNAALTLLKAQLKGAIPELNIAAGARLPGSPKTTFAVGGQYDIRFADGLTVTPRVDWQYRGTSFPGFGIVSPTPLDAYHQVNGRLTFAKQSWSVSIWIENLLDERPKVAVNNFNSVREVFTIRPRSFGVTGRVQF